MKRLFVVVALLGMFAMAALAGPIGVPVYWTTSGHYYLPVQQANTTWADAIAGAASLGGYLAVITSTAENNFIYSQISGVSSLWYQDGVGNTHGPRIGLQDIDKTGTWTWVDGEPYVLANASWYPGEPNNIGVEDSGEYFNSAKLIVGATPASTWNNVTKSFLTNGYVVEFNAPEPGTFLLLAPAIGWLAWRRRRA